MKVAVYATDLVSDVYGNARPTRGQFSPCCTRCGLLFENIKPMSWQAAKARRASASS